MFDGLYRIRFTQRKRVWCLPSMANWLVVFSNLINESLCHVKYYALWIMIDFDVCFSVFLIHQIGGLDSVQLNHWNNLLC